MGKKSPSIVYYEDRCAVCGVRSDCVPLEQHHCLHGTANRRLADQDGLTVMLCYKHHRASRTGVHGGNTELDQTLKEEGQLAYMRENHATVEDFIKRYGKNYI